MTRFHAASRRAEEAADRYPPNLDTATSQTECPEPGTLAIGHVATHPATFPGRGAAVASAGRWRHLTSAFEHAIRRREESRSEVEGPSPLGQGYQKILQRLQGYRRERGRGAVCVLSSVPGEGVSSVARKTATALSNSGLERVVLIDASLQELGTLPANEPAPPYGLSDVVCGRVPLAAALTRRDDLGLTFLASGRRTAGYQQLFSSADLPAVLSELGRDYQWAIVDGPPIMTCPEVALLAHCVGAALLVIRAESTRWEVVKEAQKILENAGVEILGAVLNRRKYHVPDFIYRRI